MKGKEKKPIKAIKKAAAKVKGTGVLMSDKEKQELLGADKKKRKTETKYMP